MVTGFGPTAGAAISSHMDIDKVIIRLSYCLFSENLKIV